MKYSILHKFCTLTLCILLGTLCLNAQVNTTQWTAESYMANINGIDVAITSNLSVQGPMFSWIQTSNLSDRTTLFAITEVSGSWDIQQNTGNLSYTMLLEDVNASLTVNGTTEEGVTAELVLYDGNGNPSDTYLFTIDTLTNS